MRTLGNLKFYIFVFGVKQVEWGREVSPIFSFVTQGFWELFLRSTTSEVARFSVWSVCRWLSQLGLVLVLLRVDATLGDGFGIWEHLYSFREVNCLERLFLKLYGWVYKTLRLWLWLRVPIQDNPRLNPMRSLIFNSRFMKFMFRISGGIKFWDPSWGLWHWQSEFNYS